LRQELVDQIAAEIRRHYSRLRCKAQGIASFTPGDKWDKYFTAAAETCIENRIAPKEFVETQFAALKPWPQITALGTQTALQRFNEARQDLAVEVAKSVMIQLGAYESLVKAGKDPKKVLIDQYQGFDPLFIYVTATLHNYQDIADDYLQAAAAQYITSSHYDAIYKEAIPQTLKELTQ